MPPKSLPTFEPFPPAHAGGDATHAYPRPQLRRASWLSLDGTWEFALDPTNQGHGPGDVKFDRHILVP
ncbi:MAG: glycoside hydrolase family 2, partial [Myxococcales bacterium]